MREAVVLVVDDDPKVGVTLSERLHAQGCEVLNASCARGGVDLALFRRPLIILVSADMPNGIAACNRMKRQSELDGVPVLLMARELRKNKALRSHRTLATRADYYLQKPLSEADIQGPLQLLLDHARKALAQKAQLERGRRTTTRKPSRRTSRPRLRADRREPVTVRRTTQEIPVVDPDVLPRAKPRAPSGSVGAEAKRQAREVTDLKARVDALNSEIRTRVRELAERDVLVERLEAERRVMARRAETSAEEPQGEAASAHALELETQLSAAEAKVEALQARVTVLESALDERDRNAARLMADIQQRTGVAEKAAISVSEGHAARVGELQSRLDALTVDYQAAQASLIERSDALTTAHERADQKTQALAAVLDRLDAAGRDLSARAREARMRAKAHAEVEQALQLRVQTLVGELADAVQSRHDQGVRTLAPPPR